MFSCKLYEIFKNTFFTPATASDMRMQVAVIYNLNGHVQKKVPL